MAPHVERTHTIVVEAPAEIALEFFTPRGEERWIAGWRPEYVHPASGETREGMVFRTGAGEGFTLWCCLLWSPTDLRARYARVTPAARFGLVDIVCRPLSSERNAVTVSYAYTALSAAGEAANDELTAPAFIAMIEGWQRDINRLVASGCL